MTTSSTETYFDALDRRGHEPLLEKASGTVRFDLAQAGGTEHWMVGIDRGDIHAAPCGADVLADCVVATDQSLFDGVLTGDVNAMAALVRGELTVDGDPELLVMFQRLVPGPIAARTAQRDMAADRRPS